jgi:hypothetical protein
VRGGGGTHWTTNREAMKEKKVASIMSSNAVIVLVATLITLVTAQPPLPPPGVSSECNSSLTQMHTKMLQSWLQWKSHNEQASPRRTRPLDRTLTRLLTRSPCSSLSPSPNPNTHTPCTHAHAHKHTHSHAHVPPPHTHTHATHMTHTQTVLGAVHPKRRTRDTHPWQDLPGTVL